MSQIYLSWRRITTWGKEGGEGGQKRQTLPEGAFQRGRTFYTFLFLLPVVVYVAIVWGAAIELPLLLSPSFLYTHSCEVAPIAIIYPFSLFILFQKGSANAWPVAATINCCVSFLCGGAGFKGIFHVFGGEKIFCTCVRSRFRSFPPCVVGRKQEEQFGKSANWAWKMVDVTATNTRNRERLKFSPPAWQRCHYSIFRIFLPFYSAMMCASCTHISAIHFSHLCVRAIGERRRLQQTQVSFSEKSTCVCLRRGEIERGAFSLTISLRAHRRASAGYTI